MHLYSEGNSPSLRPQLGVGWNRALPAPFTFQNGITPDGANDQLHVKKLLGTAMPNQISFECWMNTPASMASNRCTDIISNVISGVSGIVVSIVFGAGGTWQILIVDSANVTYSGTGTTVPLSSRVHIAFSLDITNKAYVTYVNGQKRQAGTLGYTPSANTIEFTGLFRKTIGIHALIPYQMDECRLYNRIISLDEAVSNYNMGIGNNPAKTEGLLWWFDFNVAEADTVLNPGGNPAGWTSGAWGIRDKTNNGNHAMQLNFTSNNSTLGGAITAF